ncbi:MAG: helix-turn-helix domain-containing protein [Hyphomicrobiales bacterium]
MPNNDVIGANIAMLRQARGLSQEALAERMTALGFDFVQQQVTNLERGKRALQLVEAAPLARALGVTLEQLLSVPEGIVEALEEMRAAKAPLDEVNAQLQALERQRRELRERRSALEQEYKAAQARYREVLDAAMNAETEDG